MFRKIIYFLIITFVPIFTRAESPAYNFQQQSPSNFFDFNGVSTTSKIDTAQIAKNEMLHDQDSLLKKLLGYFNLAPFSSPDGAVLYVKTVINYALWLMWLIATLSLLLWFYRMFTSDNWTEAFARAIKIVKWSFIAILLLWFSWVIVSFLMNVFFKISVPN